MYYQENISVSTLYQDLSMLLLYREVLDLPLDLTFKSVQGRRTKHLVRYVIIWIFIEHIELPLLNFLKGAMFTSSKCFMVNGNPYSVIRSKNFKRSTSLEQISGLFVFKHVLVKGEFYAR